MLTCIFAFPPPGGSVALGQVLVLGGLKVTARLGRPPKSERSHYSPVALLTDRRRGPGLTAIS